MMNLNSNFDDFLNLSKEDFNNTGLIVLTGVSGSGKSTAMRYLVERHPDFAGRHHQWLIGHPIKWQWRYEPEWLLVDEAIRIRDLVHLRRLQRWGHRLIIASHLPERLVHAVMSNEGARYFSTDIDQAKLRRFLEYRGIQSSQETLARYCGRYGANYTDLKIMLAHVKGVDFDHIFHDFERCCCIQYAG